MNIFLKHIKFTHILSISADVQGLETTYMFQQPF